MTGMMMIDAPISKNCDGNKIRFRHRAEYDRCNIVLIKNNMFESVKTDL
jgi:hypothetical protein